MKPAEAADRPVRTRRIYLWTPRRLMVNVDYMIDAFEGLAMVRTMDTGVGLLEIMATPQAEEEIEEVVAGLLETYPEIKRAERRTDAPPPV